MNFSRFASALARLPILFIAVLCPYVAGADESLQSYDIEAQPMDRALKAFAAQTEIQVAFAPETVEGLVAQAVEGDFAPESALQALIDESGLDYEFASDRLVVVHAPHSNDQGGDSDSGNASSTPVTMVQNQASTRTSPTGTTENSDENESSGDSLRMEEVIVTGTSIRGVTNPASPVITFDREDIERSGLGTLPEFIQTIPQNFTGGFTDVTANVPGAAEAGGNVTQGTGVNLRGLGSESTLTLLNGRRLSPAGLGRFTDISTIPASAVERIEVVLDGASAIYGADAVGGVVNIILRDDFEGAETTVRYETVTDGGRDAWRATQALGTSWATGNIFASYEFGSQTPLSSTERSFTASSTFPYDISPDTENHSIIGAYSQDLSSNASLFVTANYSTRETFANRASTSGNRTSDISVDQYGGVAGLEWGLPGSWLAEFSTAFNRYESDNITFIPAFDLTTSSPLASEVWAWDVRVDGDLFELPGGMVKLALGAGIRNEKLEANRTLDRDVHYAFAETLIPLVEDVFEVSVAARFEDYDDFDSSTDRKLGFVWTPVRGLQVRSTFGTSFRAPLLVETSTAPNSILALDVPDLQSPTGSSPGLFLQGNAISDLAPRLGTPLQPEESEMFTISIDFNPDFWPGFSASVTYFDIDFEDRVEAPPFSFDILQDPAFAPLVTRNPTAEQVDNALAVSEFFFNLTGLPDDELLNGGAAYIYDQRTANIAATKNKGIDLQLGYSVDVGNGQFGFNLSGTYLTDLSDRFTPTASPLERLDIFQNPIDLRLRAGLFWSNDRLSTNLFVNYADSYRNNQETPESPISSFSTVNWTTAYEFGDRDSPSLLRGVRVLFGAVNLLDEDPPFVADSSGVFGVNFDARNASPFGRLISLQISKNWFGGGQ